MNTKNSITLRSYDPQVEDVTLNFNELQEASLVIRSLNHPLRQQILNLLEEFGSMTVTQIYIKLRIEQSVASQHLAIMRKTDVLKTERNGKFIYYSLNKATIRAVSHMVQKVNV
ncbi:MAG: ArsR/SmtB family transcription factor [Chitinophagales bacterium]